MTYATSTSMNAPRKYNTIKTNALNYLLVILSRYSSKSDGLGLVCLPSRGPPMRTRTRDSSPILWLLPPPHLFPTTPPLPTRLPRGATPLPTPLGHRTPATRLGLRGAPAVAWSGSIQHKACLHPSRPRRRCPRPPGCDGTAPKSAKARPHTTGKRQRRTARLGGAAGAGGGVGRRRRLGHADPPLPCACRFPTLRSTPPLARTKAYYGGRGGRGGTVDSVARRTRLGFPGRRPAGASPRPAWPPTPNRRRFPGWPGRRPRRLPQPRHPPPHARRTPPRPRRWPHTPARLAIRWVRE